MARLSAEAGGVTEADGIAHARYVGPLLESRPNPFSVVTFLKYHLREPGPVTLRIYDILGREIATLIKQEQPAGRYQVPWHAGDRPGGIYFSSIQAGGQSATRPIFLLR